MSWLFSSCFISNSDQSLLSRSNFLLKMLKTSFPFLRQKSGQFAFLVTTWCFYAMILEIVFRKFYGCFMYIIMRQCYIDFVFHIQYKKINMLHPFSLPKNPKYVNRFSYLKLQCVPLFCTRLKTILGH